MVYFARWKAILVIVVSLLGALYAAPNLLAPDTLKVMRANLPSWAPTETVNLGLDLQGGSHLLLEVEVEEVYQKRAESLMNTFSGQLRDDRVRHRKSLKPKGFRITVLNADKLDRARQAIRGNGDLSSVVKEVDAKTLNVRFDEQALKEIRDQTLAQSIEIVRRRVDETGTREASIQRQGDKRIIVQLPGLDNPERVKELLGRTAQLSFHLVRRGEQGSAGTRTLPYAHQDGRITLKRDAIMTGDMLTSASPTFQRGQPIVSFRLNAQGTQRFCEVTTDNVNKPFAIVLDNEVISAPRINEPICGGSAVITGNFTVKEAQDLAVLLRAGALPAPLNILQERTIGPSLGKDSVEAGKLASVVALVAVLVFVLAFYGLFGLFADIALMVNVALIFAVLSGLQATLTLPGIAGIVLTIGMAVDANVLIFERIREELNAGRSVISAVDSGYNMAMKTIIDSNLTTLIAAILLYNFGTGPIRGFAVTLGIGIVSSFFSAIMVTRLMVVSWLRYKRPAMIRI